MKHKYTLLITLLLMLATVSAFAQTPTPAGTVISNRATYAYSDPGGNPHTGQSNQVDVTVAAVGGLIITPDAQAVAALVPGELRVLPFTATNTSNFAQGIVFPASGAGVRVTGAVIVTRAVIDVNSNGSIDAGDTDIATNGSAVTSIAIATNATLPVLVEIRANVNATPGSSVTVILGDASSGGPGFDNQAADSSANEVRTSDNTAINGAREARGDYTTSIEKDALITLTLTAPAGPVSPLDVMTYSLVACNSGDRAATSITLPGGGSQVYIIAPIPAYTTLQSGQSFPVGTLYSIDPVTTAPTLANFSSVPPGTLSSVRRIAFPGGASLAAAACTTTFPFNVVVATNVTPATPIVEIADVFATNALGTAITDQSGDNTPNQGNGNGSTVPIGGTAGVTGIPVVTPVAINSSVLNGPLAAPGATGPTTNNDDYTNKAGNAGIAVAPGGTTTAANVLVFDNTLQNTGNADDRFTLSTPSVSASTTVEISLDGGATWTTTSGGASTAPTASLVPNATLDYKVRVTVPVGQPVLTGLDTIVQAASQNDPSRINNTIDRVYCGYLRLTKTAVTNNTTGVGAATDAVPGAVITYNVQYENVSSSGGTGSITLTASNVVITENGNTAPNNWGTTTSHVINSATDSNGGMLTGDSLVTSTLLTDTIASLTPGATGTFSFKRKIN